MNTAISFPLLGDWSINPPTTISILGFSVHWYGVIIAVGFLLAVFYCSAVSKKFDLTPDNLVDILIVAVPVAIIGARAYFVIFNFDNYRDNLISALYVWEGGLAIYGGIIGGLAAAFAVCKAKRLPAMSALDIGSLGLLIGQAVGRWGNFINREAFGISANVSSFPLRMGLTNLSTGVTTYVHPTFLYESLWNIIGFILINIFIFHIGRKYRGQIFLMYLSWYGLGRTMIEALRTDSLYLFNTGIRVSQLLSFLVFTASLVIMIVIHVRKKHADRTVS